MAIACLQSLFLCRRIWSAWKHLSSPLSFAISLLFCHSDSYRMTKEQRMPLQWRFLKSSCRHLSSASGLIRHRLTLFALLIFSSTFIFSQNDSLSQKPKPKIGLVLSGGGAKGLAHIGVLRAIEEAGVKIDYIAGTSMGAIIGGLYASGYNAAQLDSIFSVVDPDLIIRDNIDRDYKNFYEKRQDDRYAFTLPFSNLKPKIPLSFSKALYNQHLLKRLTAHLYDCEDFSQLPIPFLCIATDIENGEEIILENGNLAQSLLASGAFPTLYKPVIIDDKYLVDGGVLNNFPVDRIRQKGIDIIIGVNVQDDLKTRDFLDEATKVLTQISNVQVRKTTLEFIKVIDIYIKPEINDFSVISFNKGKEIIRAGEEATFPIYEKLVELSTNYVKKPLKNPTLETDKITFDQIVIHGLTKFTKEYVLGKLGFDKQEQIEYQEIFKGLYSIEATKNFDDIYYTLIQNNDKLEFHLYLHENNVNTFIKLSAHYDNLFKSGLLLNITKKQVFFKNDVLATDIIIGDNTRYFIEYYKDNGRFWSFGLNTSFMQFNRNIPNDFSNGSFLNSLNIKALNIDYNNFTHQIYLQTHYKKVFKFRTGVEINQIKVVSEITTNDNEKLVNDTFGNIFATLKFDNLDQIHFPSRGMLFEFKFHNYFNTETIDGLFKDFMRFEAYLGKAMSFGKRFTLYANAEAGFIVSDGANPILEFAFGGWGNQSVNQLHPFLGYNFFQLFGNSFVKLSGQLDYRFLKKAHLNFTYNVANIGNDIFINNDWLNRPKFNGFGLGLGYETLLGPIEMKYSFSPEIKQHFLWFTVGYKF